MLIFNSGLSRNFDGPGERLIFYLKGCNFRCDWCASPESISPHPQLLYHAGRNNDANGEQCPARAYSATAPLDRSKCGACSAFACVKVWKNPAFELAGEEITPENVLSRVREMRDFIDGVTFGGGEPTLQAEELAKCCMLLKKEGVHSAIESNASTLAFQSMIGKVDLLYADLKTLDCSIARERMAADISNVAENLKYAAAHQTEFILRIPVVRDVNTQESAQQQLVSFCKQLNRLRPDKPLEVELLRQHHLGAPKYEALGSDYKLLNTQVSSGKDVLNFAEKFRCAGIAARYFI